MPNILDGRKLAQEIELILQQTIESGLEVAKRPPSKGTSGLNSGGITGITLRIIHSGLSFECKHTSINFNFYKSSFT